MASFKYIYSKPWPPSNIYIFQTMAYFKYIYSKPGLLQIYIFQTMAYLNIYIPNHGLLNIYIPNHGLLKYIYSKPWPT